MYLIVSILISFATLALTSETPLEMASNLLPITGDYREVIRRAGELVNSGGAVPEAKAILEAIAGLNIVVEALDSSYYLISACKPEVHDSYAKALNVFGHHRNEDRSERTLSESRSDNHFGWLNSLVLHLGGLLLKRCRRAYLMKITELRHWRSQNPEDLRLRDAVIHLVRFSKFLKVPSYSGALSDEHIDKDQSMWSSDEAWLESLDEKRSEAVEQPISSEPKKEKSMKDLIAATCEQIDKNAEMKKLFETGVKWALLHREFPQKIDRMVDFNFHIGCYRICKYLQGELLRQEVHV